MKRVALLITAALALIAAGCGNGDKNAYIDEFNKASKAVNSTIDTVNRSLTMATQPATLSKALESGADSLDRAADALATAETPDDAKAGHKNLVDGIRAKADEFRDAAAAVRKRKFKSADKILTQSDASEQLEKGQQQLRDAGYEIKEAT